MKAKNLLLGMKSISLFLLLLFPLLLPIPGRGAQVVLYVHHRPYGNQVFPYRGALYAAVREIFPALHYTVREKNRMICVTSPQYHGPACPAEPAQSFFYINGNPVLHGIFIQQGKIWIALHVLAQASGLLYLYNPATGIAELSGGSIYTEAANLQTTLNGAQRQNSKETTDNEPLIATITNSFNDTSTNEMRVSFLVKNVSDHNVENAVATLNYLDGYGKPMHSTRYDLGTLVPGQSVSENDYWLITTGIYPINTKVDLDWNGKKQ